MHCRALGATVVSDQSVMSATTILTSKAALSNAADHDRLNLDQLVHEGLRCYRQDSSTLGHLLVVLDCFVEPVCSFDTFSRCHIVDRPLLLLPHTHPQEERHATWHGAHVGIEPGVQLEDSLRSGKAC